MTTLNASKLKPEDAPNPDQDFAARTRQELAAGYGEMLISKLMTQRSHLGLSQAELAVRIGRNRMTVQRAEAPKTSPAISTFLELAVGLNLTPHLLTDNEKVETVSGIAPADIVHRGAHFNRTRYDLEYRDRQREAALAKAWEAANVTRNTGLVPIMATLVPGHTQAQATATATALQWLGSEIGFDFLKSALANAGYEIVDVSAKKGKK